MILLSILLNVFISLVCFSLFSFCLLARRIHFYWTPLITIMPHVHLIIRTGYHPQYHHVCKDVEQFDITSFIELNMDLKRFMDNIFYLTPKDRKVNPFSGYSVCRKNRCVCVGENEKDVLLKDLALKEGDLLEIVVSEISEIPEIPMYELPRFVREIKEAFDFCKKFTRTMFSKKK